MFNWRKVPSFDPMPIVEDWKKCWLQHSVWRGSFPAESSIHFW